MDREDIAALMTAHGQRAQEVASLHILRASSLKPSEHTFLVDHAGELATMDLTRWLGIASSSQRPDVVNAFERLALENASRFEFEVARAPKLALTADEKRALAGRLQGKVSNGVIAALSGDSTPAAPPIASGWNPADLLGDESGGDLFGGGDFSPPVGGSTQSGSTETPTESLSDLLGDDLDLFGPSGGDEPLDLPGFASGEACPNLTRLLATWQSATSTRARAAIKKEALALAADFSEDWSTRVTELPAFMRDAAVLRARSSNRPAERAALLEWLLQHKAPLGLLTDLATRLFESTQAAEGVRQWLAQSYFPKLYSTKVAWTKHGKLVLWALISRRGFGELDEFLTSTVSGASGPAIVPQPGGGQALIPAIFAAFSTALLEQLERAVPSGSPSALGLAAALTVLGIPKKAETQLGALRRKKKAKGPVLRLLSNVPSRPARPNLSLTDLITTVHVLAGTLP